MVQNGTLRVGDAVVCGSAFGRIKAMHDTLRPHVTYREAGPSTPVNATGLDVAPSAGDHFYVVDDVALARQIATESAGRSRLATLGRGVASPRHAGNPVRSARARGSGHAEHDPAGRHPRLDRSDSERALQARPSRGEDQGAAGHGRRHHRGRRPPGRRLGRGHHRLQRRARRGCPQPGRSATACKSAATTSSTS